jgi:hypothetical protein
MKTITGRRRSTNQKRMRMKMKMTSLLKSLSTTRMWLTPRKSLKWKRRRKINKFKRRISSSKKILLLSHNKERMKPKRMNNFRSSIDRSLLNSV